MPCLFVLVAGFLPRLGSILLWIARPALYAAAFGGSWLLPVLGIIFLPFTTLMYAILWSPIGLTAWDWIWLVMAVLIDIAHYGSTVYNNRNQMPGYAPATVPASSAAMSTGMPSSSTYSSATSSSAMPAAAASVATAAAPVAVPATSPVTTPVATPVAPVAPAAEAATASDELAASPSEPDSEV